MKGSSEDRVRAAIVNEVSLDIDLLLYKPPDDARNWKPADYLLWYEPVIDRETGLLHARSAFLEVKDTKRVNAFPASELRPSQRLHIRKADELHVPYWLVIWWRRKQRWTVSDAVAVLEFIETFPFNGGLGATSITYTQLSSVYGVDASAGDLGSVLKAALLGDVL